MAVSRRSGRRSILYADHELIQVSSNQVTGIPSARYTTPLGLIRIASRIPGSAAFAAQPRAEIHSPVGAARVRIRAVRSHQSPLFRTVPGFTTVRKQDKLCAQTTLVLMPRRGQSANLTTKHNAINRRDMNNKQQTGIARRDFIKLVGASSATLGLAGVAGQSLRSITSRSPG